MSSNKLLQLSWELGGDPQTVPATYQNIESIACNQFTTLIGIWDCFIRC